MSTDKNSTQSAEDAMAAEWAAALAETKPETASELTQMMISVVQAGTGTAAQIPGVQVAGKTGTAETGVDHLYTAWFVCFAPANDPKVAVAVVLEKQANGFGGRVSAPIAKALLQKLLHG